MIQFECLFSLPGEEQEYAERFCVGSRTTGSDALHDLQQDAQQYQHGEIVFDHKQTVLVDVNLVPLSSNNTFIVLSETCSTPQRPHASFQSAQGKHLNS